MHTCSWWRAAALVGPMAEAAAAAVASYAFTTYLCCPERTPWLSALAALLLVHRHLWALEAATQRSEISLMQ